MLGKSPTRSVKAIERPNYAEYDLGVAKQITTSDKESKRALQQATQAKARVAMLQAEESKLNIQLRKAMVHQKAMSSKRELMDIREADRLRREAMDRHETSEKANARNAERERKERARERMEDLYTQKLDGIHKERNTWAKEKQKYNESCRDYVNYLGDVNRNERDHKHERRQRIQDNIDNKVLAANESRLSERKRNEEYARLRREQEQREKQDSARAARDKALDYRQTHFENIVRTKKTAILEDADRKVTTSKMTARELEDTTVLVEQQERALRNRIAEQKYALESVLSATPMAASTPRMVRKPPLSMTR